MKNLTIQIERLNQNLEQLIGLLQKNPVVGGVAIKGELMKSVSDVGLAGVGVVIGEIRTVTIPETQVDSSAISKISYNQRTRDLLVTFRKSGKVYSYANVAEEVYEDFIQSNSIGRYHNKYIKNQYTVKEVQ